MDKKYLTVKEVAKLLGVTPLTLRNWDKSGKLVARRNPLNNYRVYLRDDIEDIVGKIEMSGSDDAVEERNKKRARKLKIQSME